MKYVHQGFCSQWGMLAFKMFFNQRFLYRFLFWVFLFMTRRRCLWYSYVPHLLCGGLEKTKAFAFRNHWPEEKRPDWFWHSDIFMDTSVNQVLASRSVLLLQSYFFTILNTLCGSYCRGRTSFPTWTGDTVHPSSGLNVAIPYSAVIWLANGLLYYSQETLCELEWRVSKLVLSLMQGHMAII